MFLGPLGPLDSRTHHRAWGCAAQFKTMELMEEGRPWRVEGYPQWESRMGLWPTKVVANISRILSYLKHRGWCFHYDYMTWAKNFMLCLLCLNMFPANPRFARGESRISFDILKSLRRVYVFSVQNKNPKTLKPKTLNPENLKSKSLCIASVFIHPLVISILFGCVVFECVRTRALEGTCLNQFPTLCDTGETWWILSCFPEMNLEMPRWQRCRVACFMGFRDPQQSSDASRVQFRIGPLILEYNRRVMPLKGHPDPSW